MTMISNFALHYFLPPCIDSAAVSAIRGHAALHPSTSLVILDAEKVSRFDPVGVLRLWDFCRDRAVRGCEVQLVHLPPAMRFRIRHHPLNHFVQDGEQLFDDPFAKLESGR